MSERTLSIANLLRLRLGSLGILAALGVLTLLFVIWLHGVLRRSGRMQELHPSERSLWTDLGYAAISPVSEILTRTLVTFGIAGCAILLGRHVGPALFQGFGPVMRQPRWLMILEMLVVSDFVYYWTHRAAHTFPVLWRFHSIHHSTPHLRWTSALRAHPAEAYVHLVNVVPLFLLGFPVDSLVALAPLITGYAFVIHTKFDVSAGFLNGVLNSPRFHGWHHARDVEGAGVNFAGFFPVWDMMFGTYSLPDRRPDAVGIRDERMPDTCLAQLVYPLAEERRDPAMPESIPPAPEPWIASRPVHE